jgi:hypothetical protein
MCCSFCHKAESAVGKLISSPSDYPRAYICDECIAVCNSIIEDGRHIEGYVEEEVFDVRLNLSYLQGTFQMTRSEAEQLRDRLTVLLASPSPESPAPQPSDSATASPDSVDWRFVRDTPDWRPRTESDPPSKG